MRNGQMRPWGRRLAASVAVVAMTGAAVLSGITPAQAAEPPPWVPARAALPSSYVAGDALERLKVDMAQSVVGKGRIDPHLYLQTAAAKGAYIPGLSDAAAKAGVSPYAISETQARAAYAGYSTDMARPGQGSAISASTQSRGVVSVQGAPAQGGARGALNKGGAAMGRALGVATIGYAGWSLGTAVGGGVASMIGLPSSGSMVCDLTNVFGSDAGCNIAADPGYTINADALGMSPGWVGLPLFTNTWQGGALNGKTHDGLVSIVNAPKFKQIGAGPTAAVTWQYPGGLNPREMTGESGSAQVNTTGQIVVYYGPTSIWSTENVRMRTSGSGAATQLVNPGPLNISSGGTGFDHLEVRTPVDPSSGKTVAVAQWYPVGHSLRPPDVEADPERWWRTDWKCTDGAAASARSASFRESDAAWAVPENARCATGEVASMTITQVTVGMPDVVVYEWSMPTETAAFLGAFPECSNGQCTLDLLTTVTGTQVSCFLSPELCTNWLTSPTRDTDYQCTYAGQPMALSECFLYGPSFNQSLVESGQVYGDPETGEALVPAPVPGGTPGGQPSPTPQPQPQDANCPPKFTATSVINPWWYYKGMQCALVLSFVPTSSIDRWNEIDLSRKTPVPQLTSMVAWMDPQTVGTACLDVDIKAPMNAGTVEAFSSCSDDKAVSWLRDHRPLMSVAVWASFVFGLLWWAWRTYAPGAQGNA